MTKSFFDKSFVCLFFLEEGRAVGEGEGTEGSAVEEVDGEDFWGFEISVSL